jgi:hypothetical protein
MKEEDFCEETLKIKDITLIKDEFNGKIEIFSVEDEFTELLKVLEVQERLDSPTNNYEIYDANENYSYNKFFVETNYLSNLPIYSLLEGIHEILLNLEVIDGELALDLYSGVEAIKSKELSGYYRVSNDDFEKLKEIVGDGYKYLTSYIIEEKLGKDNFLYRIFEDMEEIKEYTTLKKWMGKLTKFKNLDYLLGENEKNIGKYLEALSEIEVIEDFKLVGDWDNFFGYHLEEIMRNIKKSEGLLRLILKYLKFKEIDSPKTGKNLKLKLEDMKTVSSKTRIFMNISDIYIPKVKENMFLFTEQQKKKLGIRGLDEIRLEEKYNLFRGIVTSNNSIILGIKNMEKNSSLSPFIEELRENFNLNVVHLKQDIKNYLELINPVNTSNKGDEIQDIVGELPQKMEFKLDELGDRIRLNAYMCDELFKCKYKMYMRYIEKLQREDVEVDKNLTHREYGILAHELFETVLDKLEKTKDYTPFIEGEINKEFVMEVLEVFIKRRKLKLPMLNEKYYTEIIYKNLVKSVGIFFRKMSFQLKGMEIKKLIIEKNLREKLIDEIKTIEGSAKADLIIVTENKDFIIDFKTGGLNERQLDFYSILYEGEADSSRKYIFNVDKGELKESIKVKMYSEDLNEELKSWIKSGEYERVKSSKCGRCEYVEICRIGELEDGK